MSIHTMIGTYVFLTEIPSKEKKITKTIFTCSDKKCINYLKNLNDNFCNICGSKITFVDFVETVNEECNFNWVKYDYGNNDIFYKPECFSEIIIPNIDYEGNVSIYIDNEDIGAKEIPNSKDAMDALSNSSIYKPFFEYIANLGYKFVIKFGILTYSY